MRAVLPLLLLSLVGCKPDEGLVLYHVGAAPSLAGLGALSAQISIDDQTRELSYPLPAGVSTLPPVQTLGVEIPASLLPAAVTTFIRARSLDGSMVAEAALPPHPLGRGEQVDVDVVLGARVNESDLAGLDLVGVDLRHVPDLSAVDAATADAGADLSAPADMSLPIADASLCAGKLMSGLTCAQSYAAIKTNCNPPDPSFYPSYASCELDNGPDAYSQAKCYWDAAKACAFAACQPVCGSSTSNPQGVCLSCMFSALDLACGDECRMH